MTGKQLQKLLDKNNLSQNQCAKVTGYNASTINRYVNGLVIIPKKFEILLNGVLQGAQQ